MAVALPVHYVSILAVFYHSCPSSVAWVGDRRLRCSRLNGDIAGDETAHQTDEQVGICCSPLAHSALNAAFSRQGTFSKAFVNHLDPSGAAGQAGWPMILALTK